MARAALAEPAGRAACFAARDLATNKMLPARLTRTNVSSRKVEKMKRSSEKANRDSDSCAIEKRFENYFCFEYFAGQCTRGPRVFPIVGIDSFYRSNDFS